MKLNFNHFASLKYMNLVHPSGYKVDEFDEIVPINGDEDLIFKDIDLRNMWLIVNTMAIRDIDWTYDTSSNDEGFVIDTNKYLDLVNEFGTLNMVRVFNEDLDQISAMEEDKDNWFFLLTSFHQYSYQGTKNNKKLFNLIGNNLSTLGEEHVPKSEKRMSELLNDFTERKVSMNIKTEITVNNGAIWLDELDLMTAYLLYSLQTKLGEIIWCRNCGNNFINESQGKSALYCSSRCKTAYYRRNKK